MKPEVEKRVNGLAAAYCDLSPRGEDRQVGEGILHVLRLMTGSQDGELAGHVRDILGERVRLDDVEAIELGQNEKKLFQDIYLYGSGISTENANILTVWLETGTIPR